MYYVDQIIKAIEDAAHDCGTINLNVRQFAWENGYYDYDRLTGDYELSLTALQEIADIFTNGFDVMGF